MGVRWCLTGFDSHFLLTRDAEPRSLGSLAIPIASLEKCLFRSFACFLIRLLWVLLLSYSSLYTLLLTPYSM